MRTTLIAAVAAVALNFMPVAAQAADAPPAAAHVEKIAVVDVQALLNDSKAGKSIQAQIKKQSESFKDEFSKLEKDLEATKKKLIDDKANANTPEFAAKQKDFEARMNDARKVVQQKKMALEKGAADAVLELRKAVVKVVADIADKEKYTLVVTRDNVVLAEKEMDITEKVMVQMDKDLPDVKVKVDAAKAPTPAAPAKK